ncbi:tetratricopeptide repeat protein [Archangium gephyra]|uniref:tetratricopeptide repeat protein n=1 Tax=Archangium gephyra TaxID=48 RepID=UPI003B7C4371
MSDFPSFHWRHYAQVQLARGDHRGALETLRRGLAQEPEDPEAHALLSLVLLSLKRPHAAEHEAGIALSLEPMLPLAHAAAASAAMARRRFKDAEQHLKNLLELEPDDTSNLRLQARFLELHGQEAAQAGGVGAGHRAGCERPGHDGDDGVGRAGARGREAGRAVGP